MLFHSTPNCFTTNCFSHRQENSNEELNQHLQETRLSWSADAARQVKHLDDFLSVIYRISEPKFNWISGYKWQLFSLVYELCQENPCREPPKWGQKGSMCSILTCAGGHFNNYVFQKSKSSCQLGTWKVLSSPGQSLLLFQDEYEGVVPLYCSLIWVEVLLLFI